MANSINFGRVVVFDELINFSYGLIRDSSRGTLFGPRGVGEWWIPLELNGKIIVPLWLKAPHLAQIIL